MFYFVLDNSSLEIFLIGVPLVGLQVSATFLHPQVCSKSLMAFFSPLPTIRFTQQELKEGKLHVTELTDKWYQDIQASPLLSGGLRIIFSGTSLDLPIFRFL